MTERAAAEEVLVRLIEDYWNGQGLARIDAVFAADAVVHFGATDYVGHKGINEEFAGPFMAAFPDLRHEILDLLIDGGRASMRYRGTGHMQQDYGGAAASGQPFLYHGIAVFRLEGGRIAEVWSNSDMAAWLAAQPKADAGPLLAVTLAHGPAWDQGRMMDEQDGWDAHATFMDGLTSEGFVALGGPLEGTGDALLAIRATDEAEVRSRFEADPWHASGHLRVKSVVPWRLRLGGL